MDIVVTVRHTALPPDFRSVLAEKLTRVEHLAPRAHRLEVAVSHEPNRRQADACERLELTLLGKGPVVRAEARAGELTTALDQALDRLVERLRRAGDRRKVHHGRHTLPSVRGERGVLLDPGADLPLPAGAPDGALDGAPGADLAAVRVTAGAEAVVAEYALGESPVVIRDKVHVAKPMSLDDALAEMELVGHDFFLFVDAAVGCPSVVYRRHGYSYGVIRLAGDLEEAEAACRAVASSSTSVTAPGATTAPDGTSGPAARQPVAGGSGR